MSEPTKEYLKDLYINKKLTTREIAGLVNLSPRTVTRRLQKHGINLRNPGAEHFVQLDDKEWLQNLYCKQKLTPSEIGKKIGANGRTVTAWLKRHSITRRKAGGQLKGKKMSSASRRKMSEAKDGMYLGPQNPNWKGNRIKPEIRERRSYIAKKWRHMVLERDGYKCQTCGALEKLHVHHILSFNDYPKRRWDINNGIVLCATCHEKQHDFAFPDWAVDRIPSVGKDIDNVQIQKKVKFNPTKKKLEELYQSYSINEIAQQYFVSTETVRKRLIENNIPRRKNGPRRQFSPEKRELKRLYQTNSMKELATIFDVGETVIHKRIHEYGITKKK
jgi:DNA-binding CsgD family transcriptional regulator